MSQRRRMWTYAFTSLLVTICAVGFARMSYGILMPSMRESLSLTYEQAGLLGTASSVGYLGIVIFAGIMAAKWGSKRLVVIGTTLVASGLFYLFTVQSFLASFAGMFVLGVGTAFIYTPLVNIVVQWFPKNRGLMVGFLVSGLGLGTLISSLLIPFFTTWFAVDGWRYLWLLFGIISFIASIIALFVFEEPPKIEKNPNREEESLFREVYFQKDVMLVAIIYGLIGFAYLIPQSFLFSYILEMNINQYTAAQIMAIGSMMSIFSGPLWGSVSDKIGRKMSFRISLFLGASAILIPVLFPSYWGFLISQLIWGITIVGIMSLVQVLSTEQVDSSYAPVALGYATAVFAFGQLLGPGLGGWMIDHAGGIPAALLLCCSLLVTAFLLSAKLKTAEAYEQVLEDHVNEEVSTP